MGGVGFKPQRTGDTGVEGWVGGVGFKPQRTGNTGEGGVGEVGGGGWPQRTGGSGGERRGRASFLDSNLGDPKFINMP